MSYADAQVGRVLDALTDSPYADNTIVVLCSHHGWCPGDKGQWCKKMLWERTSNVPFIRAGPNVAKGKKTDVTVSLIYMYPTFIELCGLQSPVQKLDGLSIASTLKNPTTTKDRKVYLIDYLFLMP